MTNQERIDEAQKTTDEISKLIETAVMDIHNSASSDQIKIVLWMFVNEHTKLLRKYYKIGE